MSIDEILSRTITGIEPFNELQIDAEIWDEAHERHTHHRALHAVTHHRPGIVCGLEVIVDPDRQGKFIVIGAGAAVDAKGNIAVLKKSTRFPIEKELQPIIAISYSEDLDQNSTRPAGSGKKPFRLLEGREISLKGNPPPHPYIELARIDRSGPNAPVSEAENPFDPGEDELNLLYRTLTFPYCFADVKVAELVFTPQENAAAWKPNRAGLCHLIRQAEAAGIHAEYQELYDLSRPVGKPSLLYVSIADAFRPLSEGLKMALAGYLADGGTLFAEASLGNENFAAGFRKLAEELSLNLQPVTANHPLLTSHFVFPNVPVGSVKGTLEADFERGVIFSTCDYGGAWQADRGISRGAVRDATEFGFNILAAAGKRQRRHEILRSL